ncbi:FAD-binding oxidoreductase [Paraburkholderia phymatum]|uniref:FAD dependent oxidoreductase n=1 Tax=Paraburkholderia phymatum (strain DSM 17167 / CIP 108236 / LMG 21445 / STM815) TaxID=391038 RepID=B2JFR6_PARP8|nr:FAD-binding oxidoreductase [Paraburkholderia phymatum]ACC71541.1 FAD dependent oxidoreductase [Paraburkholderia phymatum STM815]
MTEVKEGSALPDSLWAATAQPAPDTPPLRESASFDVAIVGAGFTGLSTALHLAERGVKVCVLDAAEPGWGASGRNGGQVIPGLKYDPDELVQRFGETAGNRLVETVGAAADNVFDLIDRYGIECSAIRRGWIQPAPSPAMLGTVMRRARQWEARGVKISLLDGAQVSRRLGTASYIGGWVDHRAGCIQPLSYVRGLARAAQSLGVAVHGRTSVSRLVRDERGWRVETQGGAVVEAQRVVIATNGYTGALWPGLRQSVIAANSFIVATQPLARGFGDDILRGGEVASDSRRLLLYFRRDAAGRLLMGGRGPFSEPRANGDWAHLERAVELMYPQLKGVSYEYRWAGRVAITADFLPHIHEPAPGLSIALGYNGRGIAMATTVGKHLAARMCEESAASFPFAVTPVRPILFHELQRFYITAGVAWYRLMDAIA